MGVRCLLILTVVFFADLFYGGPTDFAGDQRLLLLTVGLLLIYCVGDRPLSLWGIAFVERLTFSCLFQPRPSVSRFADAVFFLYSQLQCGGPATDYGGPAPVDFDCGFLC